MFRLIVDPNELLCVNPPGFSRSPSAPSPTVESAAVKCRAAFVGAERADLCRGAGM